MDAKRRGKTGARGQLIYCIARGYCVQPEKAVLEWSRGGKLSLIVKADPQTASNFVGTQNILVTASYASVVFLIQMTIPDAVTYLADGSLRSQSD